ncbi:hypothetical protein QR680_013594 [Steinernema hermaphroditum]|uniref:Peptidase S1 domain-containing protein n=1 Tax=Steinernema hermaphroditum TaxID=289476 RepID=A0AA39I8N4_9BILA|nr:hypothetical protein QR680_013594 [Steinernema hermaphroditum]
MRCPPLCLFLLYSSPLSKCFDDSLFVDTVQELVPPGGLIFGGIPSRLGQWPSFVFIYYRMNGTVRNYMCGGTLLSPTHVLTAAHCTEDLVAPSFAMTAVANLAGIFKQPDVQIREITSFSRHPDYSPGDTYLHDIAILSLNDSLALDENTQLGRILDDDRSLVDVGHGVVTGFGVHEIVDDQQVASQRLLWTEVPFRNHTWCIEQWKDLSGDKVHVKPNQICYGAKGKGTGTGDSGGPIQVQTSDGEWYQIGIISFGVGEVEDMPNQNKFPSVGTRIAPYCDFLESATRNAFSCLRGCTIKRADGRNS